MVEATTTEDTVINMSVDTRIIIATVYIRGYASVRSSVRWSDDQKDAYDRGYNFGDDDWDRRISRLPARYEGRYDRNYEAYYRRGYFDGYDQQPKRYDYPIGRVNSGIGGTTVRDRNGFPRRPGGTLNWSGRVDNRVNIVIRGSTFTTQTIAGRTLGGVSGRMSGALPRRQAQLSVRKLDGRGSVFVIQQPNRVNGYTAIVQISDPRSSDDNYRILVSWQSSNALETYTPGRVRWKGRVDATVNIRIFGDELENGCYRREEPLSGKPTVLPDTSHAAEAM